MFKPEQEVHIWSEEVGIINGYYVGVNTFFKNAPHGKYLDFRDMTGQLCLVQNNQMEAGFHPKGKKRWGAK